VKKCVIRKAENCMLGVSVGKIINPFPADAARRISESRSEYPQALDNE
jgi:hypothetical protein